MCNQSAKVGPWSAVRARRLVDVCGKRGRERGDRKKGGRNGGWRRQGEEKRDPPVVEVAPATSWRGRTRPTIPKKLEAEERRATLESLALSGVSPSKSRSIDRS